VSGFFSGVADGANIVADTFTFGKIAPLHDHVEQIVAENGGSYQVAQVAATVARESTIMVVTAGAGSVGTCAGRATYGSVAFYAAKGIQVANTASNAYGTYQSAGETSEAWQRGDVYGVVTNGAFTLLGALGTVGDIKALGKACFAAGTPLLTPDGSRPIEELQVGDWVLSRHENDPEGHVEARRVLTVFQTYSPLLDLHVGGQIIRTTAEHPFWVVGRGWVAAQQLMCGDRLLGAGLESTAVTSVHGAEDSAPVYNVEIDEYHTYWVGRDLWGFVAWAHNTDCPVGPVNLNSNEAKSEFGIYEITVNGELFKVGKADLARVTQSTGMPTRLHQQLRKLRAVYDDEAVVGEVVEELGVTTTRAAKDAEIARLQRIFDETETIPAGNRKSFFPQQD
jgi:hypothetical protein